MNFRSAVILLPLLLTSSVVAQTSYPMIMSVTPVAAQAGTSSEHTVESRYSMFGASLVLVTGEGVTGEVVTKMEPDKDGKEPSLTKIAVRFTVSQDALPGVRDFRIVGPTGASTLGQLVIVRDPVIIEDPKNDTTDTAQPITLPATVCGAVEKSEDVDFYRFSIDQPATLTFHCQAMRLEDKIHDLQTHVDPIITLRSARTGATVASVDNSYAADPLLTQALTPGEYLLEVRDVRYSGNRYWNYSIEINDRPFVSHVHPTAVAPGQSAELQLIGPHLPAVQTVAWTPPPDVTAGALEVQLPTESGLTNPVSVMVSRLPMTIEAGDDNSAPDQAQLISVPGAVTGRIEAEADIDCFRFEAKKGDTLSLEVKARRHWSALDSIVRLLNADGRQLVENDDLRLWNRMTVQDSGIENWTVPADGEYVIEIRDVHLRGGDDFVYLLEVTRAEPAFELVLDSDKSWLTPGTSAALFVRAVRKNGFDQEIQLHVDGLPDGVTAACGRILAGKGQDGCIILTAAPQADLQAANIHVWGTAVVQDPETPSEAVNDTATAIADPGNAAEPVAAVAQAMQEIYMPGGGRSHWPVSMHTVAVGRPADILNVRLSTYELTLKPGEAARVDVEIVRAEGFDKNVTLDLLFQHLSSKFANTLPEGVTIDAKKSQTLLTGTNSKGSVTLVAAAGAPPVSRHQCCVMANVSINFVMKATYSSRPLLITVAAP